MKHLLICALIAFIPASLSAADRLSVEASFFSAAPGTKIPNDLQKLNRTKGISRKTARTTATSGGVAKVEATRTFVLGTQVFGDVAGRGHSVPTGFTVHVTPRVRGDQVTYRAHLTIRDFSGFNNPKHLPRSKFTGQFSTATAFTTREVYMSGATSLGDVAWLFVPAERGQPTFAVCLQFNRKDA